MAKAGFRGGVHPPTHKDVTSASATHRAPIPARLVLPMSQHLGAPCTPLVAAGDRVLRGQPIGDVEAMVSAPVHSPVAGEVAAVTSRRTITGNSVTAVEIVPDPEQDFDTFEKIDPVDNVVTLVRSAGIVGMGGAAFPAHVKLTPPKDATIETVILNGCECEPYLTCDHRTMLERASRVVEGSRIIARTVGARRIVIGIEDNKPDAILAVREAADTDIEVLSLQTSYPQGAEKQLIWAVMAKEVPHGKLPSAAGALVHNVGTAAAIADAVLDRRPLMERVVTVSGMVARPGNYLTLLGTSVQDLLDAAGGFTGEVGRVIAGGPMTGMPVVDFSVPVVKGTSGVVALAPGDLPPAVHGDQPCIRCGRCSDACPMLLEPFALGIRANRLDWDGCDSYHGLDCIECGCCSYVCPTHRPLVQLIRRAKHALLERGARS